MRRQRTIYDRNGNFTHERTARRKGDGHYEPAGMERKLLWDEENRLTALSENGYVSAYVYDADGERTVKMHGGGSASYRNAADSAVTTARPKYALYASPYFMRDEQGNYLKHIYIGSDRIVSQVVRGSWASDNNPKGGTIANFGGLMTQSKYKAKKDSLQSALNQRYADLQVPFKGVDRDSFIYNSNPAQARATIQQSGTYESQQYFYHKDHLGSSTIITTLDGTITQHVQYIPYGEVFIEQQNDAEWSSPFRFTGKELDEETGLYYFGARYFDPKIVNWLSTDPLERRYPHVNSYGYTIGNPVHFIDNEGKEPIFNIKGDFLGTSSEGYTGLVLIYSGNEKINFSDFTKDELLNSYRNDMDSYDLLAEISPNLGGLSNEAKSNIWTHVASQFEGEKIYDDYFSLASINNSKISFRQQEKTESWTTHIHLNSPVSLSEITGSGIYPYETTVENIASSIILHEWYSHDRKNVLDNNHWIAYMNVFTKNDMWSKTTEKYKSFVTENYYKYLNMKIQKCLINKWWLCCEQ